MKTWIWRGSRTAAALGLTAIFLLGVLAGALTMTHGADGGAENGAMPQPGATDSADDTGAQDAVSADETYITPSTKVEWITVFSRCGHEKIISDNESAVGMDIDDLRNTYPGYEVMMFTGAQVKLKRTLDAFCPDHLVLRLDGTRLGVYRTNADTLQPENVMMLDFDTAQLDEQERDKLIEGLPFDTLGDIDEYLENAES